MLVGKGGFVNAKDTGFSMERPAINAHLSKPTCHVSVEELATEKDNQAIIEWFSGFIKYCPKAEYVESERAG